MDVTILSTLFMPAGYSAPLAIQLFINKIDRNSKIKDDESPTLSHD